MAKSNTFTNDAGELIHEEDRVYSYYFKNGKSTGRVYGTIKVNDYNEHPKWYIQYDDGIEVAVLNPKYTVYKA